jgi:hypothetical protein
MGSNSWTKWLMLMTLVGGITCVLGFDMLPSSYVVKLLRIVNVLHNVDNGSKTTLISCDVARCKGGEFLCRNNIDITWRFSLYQLHCCKQLNPKGTKKIMQNNIKVINCKIPILHSRALWASQTKSDTRSWVLLGFCYTLNSDSLKP